MTALPLAVAFVGGVAACAALRAVAWRCGVVNQPNPIVPQHTRPVAYLGGAGIAVGAALALAAFAPGRGWMAEHAAVAVPSLLMLLVGTVDDVRVFLPAVKFLLQAAAAALGVALGARHAFTGLAYADALVSWLWIVTVVNAFNLTDVCDGLVAGLAVIAFLAIALMVPAWAPAVLPLAGATLGFLVFNRPDASMFLGDGGSHLLGALVATLMLTAPAGAGWGHAWPMLLVAAVPLFELVFLVVVRSRQGLRWWRGSPDHVALRLQRRGFSKLQADAALWLTAAALAALAVTAPRWAGEPGASLAVAALLIAAAGAVWRFLERPGARA